MSPPPSPRAVLVAVSAAQAAVSFVNFGLPALGQELRDRFGPSPATGRGPNSQRARSPSPQRSSSFSRRSRRRCSARVAEEAGWDAFWVSTAALALVGAAAAATLPRAAAP